MDSPVTIEVAPPAPRVRRARSFAWASIGCSLALSVITGAIPKFPGLRGEFGSMAGLILGGGALVALMVSFVFARRGSFRYPLLAMVALGTPLIAAVVAAAMLGIEVPR